MVGADGREGGLGEQRGRSLVEGDSLSDVWTAPIGRPTRVGVCCVLLVQCRVGVDHPVAEHLAVAQRFRGLLEDLRDLPW